MVNSEDIEEDSRVKKADKSKNQTKPKDQNRAESRKKVPKGKSESVFAQYGSLVETERVSDIESEEDLKIKAEPDKEDPESEKEKGVPADIGGSYKDELVKTEPDYFEVRQTSVKLSNTEPVCNNINEKYVSKY